MAIAPTPHPLANLGAILLSPLSSLQVGGLHGELAATVVVGLAYISLALLGWVVFALGREWFNTAAGALAAMIVLTRVPVLDFGARAYVDIPFLVLLLGALLVETRRPRSGGPVLALLALAGLLRPEAWLFSAVYVLWLLWPGLRSAAARAGPRRSAALRDAAPLIALAASGPLLWALHDLLLTGNALHSLTGTRDNAATLGRVTGIQNVPTTVPRRLGEILREPVLFAAAGGGLLALAWRRDRRVRLGAAASVLALGAFTLLALAGLPIITRYVMLMAVAAGDLRRARACSAGWICCRAASARGGRGSRSSRSSGSSCSSPTRRTGSSACRARSRRRRRSRASSPSSSTTSRLAQPVAVPNRRPIPLLALWLELAPGDLVDAQGGLPSRGSYLVPATAQAAHDYILDPRDRDRQIPAPPADAVLRAANSAWRLYDAGPRNAPATAARPRCAPARPCAAGFSGTRSERRRWTVHPSPRRSPRALAPAMAPAGHSRCA